MIYILCIYITLYNIIYIYIICYIIDELQTQRKIKVPYKNVYIQNYKSIGSSSILRTGFSSKSWLKK